MGRAYAIEFAKLGAKLALNDFDEESLNVTKNNILALGKNTEILTAAFDVSDFTEMKKFGDRLEKEMGYAHVIINNAGIETSGKSVKDMDSDDFNRNLKVNLNGVFNGTKVFIPHLEANNEGALVNISSIFGMVGIPDCADYCAAKFAVAGFTQSLMTEYYQSPITIHCVHPGGINTNISRRGDEKAIHFHQTFLKTPPEKIARHVINGIRKKRQRIVYGYMSFPVWLASKFCPLSLWSIIINQRLS